MIELCAFRTRAEGICAKTGRTLPEDNISLLEATPRVNLPKMD